MSGHLEQRHFTLLKTTRCELKINWLVSYWIILGAESYFKWLKLRFCQNLIRLNKLVPKNFTQLNFLVWPSETATLETWLCWFFQSFDDLTWKIISAFNRKTVRSSSSKSGLFNQLFVIPVADTKRVNSRRIFVFFDISDDLIFVKNLTICQKKNYSLLSSCIKTSGSFDWFKDICTTIISSESFYLMNYLRDCFIVVLPNSFLIIFLGCYLLHGEGVKLVPWLSWISWIICNKLTCCPKTQNSKSASNW